MLIAMLLGIAAMATAAPVSDVIQFPTGYFTPTATSGAPYYRWYNEDWSWSHNALSTSSATTAKLSISAWDVDYYSYDGERDLITAYNVKDSAVESIGYLIGQDSAWAYTDFALDLTQWGSSIDAGLQVFIDIDSTHNYQNWAVLLAKSVLTLDNGYIPPPQPNPVPEPSTLVLLGGGLLSLVGLQRKLKK
jgi:hypothetical protein